MVPAAPPPLSGGGGGNPSPREEGPAGWSTAVTQHRPPPPSQTASPSCGVAGRSRQAGTQLARHHTHLPTSPSAGLDGRLVWDVETQQQPLTPPACPSHSFAGFSWASIVREGEQLRDPLPPLHSTLSATITREDFLTLYERCTKSGLKARFSVRHASGLQEVSLMCTISPSLSNNPALPSQRRRCRRHRQKAAATDASDVPPPAAIAATATSELQSVISAPPPAPFTPPALMAWPPEPLQVPLLEQSQSPPPPLSPVKSPTASPGQTHQEGGQTAL
jgi:hypothetical protein